MKDVQTELSMEEYVSNMVQRERLADMKDVPMLLSRKGYASDMVQRCSAKLSRSRVNVVDVRKGCVRVVVTETEIVRYLFLINFVSTSLGMYKASQKGGA